MWTTGKDRKFRMRKYSKNTGTNIYAARIRGVNDYIIVRLNRSFWPGTWIKLKNTLNRRHDIVFVLMLTFESQTKFWILASVMIILANKTFAELTSFQ